MNKLEEPGRWYHGIKPYHWLVLLIASLGWIFDVFEGQIFVASMNEAMPSLLPPDTDDGTVDFYNKISLCAFLIGGALGGVFFGVLSDRIGRSKTMIITIVVYSLFTCITALAQNWWQMAFLRFFVALGTGGEWAVASAMVAEVVPKRARAWCGAIFHGSSVFGTYLAVLAGAFIVGNPDISWRWGFAIGALPALLTIWIRLAIKEPDKWKQAQTTASKEAKSATGRLEEIFQGELLKRTCIGVSLAAVGLSTFWGVHIYGKNLLRQDTEMRQLVDLDLKQDVDQEERKEALEPFFSDIKKQEMVGMFLVSTGGGLGLLLFAPICDFIGRRWAFIFYHVVGFLFAVALFQTYSNTALILQWSQIEVLGTVPLSRLILLIALPCFGAATLGMHAGYAIYFPELYPTRLRGSGCGFCFNVGRILAAPILFLTGWMQRDGGMTVYASVTLLSFLFMLGVVIVFFSPETKGQDLPE